MKYHHHHQLHCQRRHSFHLSTTFSSSSLGFVDGTGRDGCRWVRMALVMLVLVVVVRSFGCSFVGSFVGFDSVVCLLWPRNLWMDVGNGGWMEGTTKEGHNWEGKLQLLSLELSDRRERRRRGAGGEGGKEEVSTRPGEGGRRRVDSHENERTNEREGNVSED